MPVNRNSVIHIRVLLVLTDHGNHMQITRKLHTPSAATVASAPDTAAIVGSTVVFPGPMSICLDFSYAAK